MQAHDLVHGVLAALRLPRPQRVDAEETAAIRLVPLMCNKLVKASTVAAPAYLGRSAAVALIRKRAEVDRAGAVLKETCKKIAGAHGKRSKGRGAAKGPLISVSVRGQHHAALPLNAGMASSISSAKDS